MNSQLRTKVQFGMLRNHPGVIIRRAFTKRSTQITLKLASQELASSLETTTRGKSGSIVFIDYLIHPAGIALLKDYQVEVIAA